MGEERVPGCQTLPHINFFFFLNPKAGVILKTPLPSPQQLGLVRKWLLQWNSSALFNILATMRGMWVGGGS